jgi:hypothetical protein
MKILKKILFVVVAVIVATLIIAAFTRKEYAIKKEITIQRPANDVFNYVKHLKNQEHYITWTMQDAKMKSEYRGTDGTLGAVTSWESETMGKGEQEIVSLEENKHVGFKLKFIEPWEGLASSEINTETVDVNVTRVSWEFKSEMPYPMNIMLLVMNMENMMGEELQKGLVNLKSEIEK